MADNQNRKMVKVWADGCYDMVHFGHANQLRQAKSFGDYLIVGVHTDEEIAKHKGPPVFNQEERYRMVRAIKWVDQVVEGAPYVTSMKTMDEHGCDFCVHGDDITLTADGSDTYAEVKAAGRYQECKRTAGVSTTDLVGRMLLMTRTHLNSTSSDVEVPEREQMSRDLAKCGLNSSPWTTVSAFMPSTRQILQFTEGRMPKPHDRIIYCPGSFDLFHIGHLAFLEEAAKLGDYLIIGLHDDHTVNAIKGGNHPVQTMHERLLSCLAYKPVSEVVLEAPYTVTQDVLDRFKIDIVCIGIESDLEPDPLTGQDPYADVRAMGKLRQVDSKNDMTTDGIINRILQHRMLFERRNKKKQAKEIAAFEALQKQQNGTMGSVNIDVIAATKHLN